MWAYIEHPDTHGVGIVPVAAVPAYEARGWVSADPPTGLDLTSPTAPIEFAEDSTVAAGHTPRLTPAPRTAAKKSASTTTREGAKNG